MHFTSFHFYGSMNGFRVSVENWLAFALIPQILSKIHAINAKCNRWMEKRQKIYQLYCLNSCYCSMLTTIFSIIWETLRWLCRIGNEINIFMHGHSFWIFYYLYYYYFILLYRHSTMCVWFNFRNFMLLLCIIRHIISSIFSFNFFFLFLILSSIHSIWLKQIYDKRQIWFLLFYIFSWTSSAMKPF